MSEVSGPCVRCGGSPAHHKNDRACWCPKCISGPDAERCAEYTPGKAKPPAPPVDRDVVRVGSNHPKTAHDAAEKAKPKSGTLRRLVYDQIARSGATGATDDEIERALNRSHQSVSGARNTLSGDGLIRDSGLRRKTRYHNEAIAWVVTDAADQAEAQDAVVNPLDLSGGPAVEVDEGIAVVTDEGVTLTVPADADLPVTVTVGTRSMKVMPVRREALWEIVSSAFSSTEEIEDACRQVYTEVHEVSSALKGLGR